MKRFVFAAVQTENSGGQTDVDERQCDWDGCNAEGAHPAPRSRTRLQDRYWFCKEHAREYNRAWNYFAGMSADEIEQERRKDTIWQRPTWPFSRGNGPRPTWQSATESQANRRPKRGREPQTAAECHAASTLGLATPYTKTSLKTCYRNRIKAAHPDLNPDDPHAEDRFKELQEAYMTLLRPLST
jgi:hypothetical protein